MKCPHCFKGWQLKHSFHLGAYEQRCKECNGTGINTCGFQRFSNVLTGMIVFAFLALVVFNIWRQF